MTTAPTVGRRRGSAQPRGGAAPPVTPLFVVGVPFSGATTLAWAIGQDPAFVPLVGAAGVERLVTALRVVEEEVVPLLEPSEFAGLFAGGAARAAERTWVVAGPGLAGRIGTARKLLPELRVVHVYRAAETVVPKLIAESRRQGAELSERDAEGLWLRSVD